MVTNGLGLAKVQLIAPQHVQFAEVSQSVLQLA
jgi:hypothetical protein